MPKSKELVSSSSGSDSEEEEPVKKKTKKEKPKPEKKKETKSQASSSKKREAASGDEEENVVQEDMISPFVVVMLDQSQIDTSFVTPYVEPVKSSDGQESRSRQNIEESEKDEDQQPDKQRGILDIEGQNSCSECDERQNDQTSEQGEVDNNIPSSMSCLESEPIAGYSGTSDTRPSQLNHLLSTQVEGNVASESTTTTKSGGSVNTGFSSLDSELLRIKSNTVCKQIDDWANLTNSILNTFITNQTQILQNQQQILKRLDFLTGMTFNSSGLTSNRHTPQGRSSSSSSSVQNQTHPISSHSYQHSETSFQQGTVKQEYMSSFKSESVPIVSEQQVDASFFPRMATVESIARSACSIGNFCSRLVKEIFTEAERTGTNCSGRRGKRPLNPAKLQVVKDLCFQFYNIAPDKQEETWKRCVMSIDESLRRRKYSMTIK